METILIFHICVSVLISKSRVAYHIMLIYKLYQELKSLKVDFLFNLMVFQFVIFLTHEWFETIFQSY